MKLYPQKEDLRSGSENVYFDIEFVDKELLKITTLHIGFTYLYLNSSPEARNIDFNKVIEIEKVNLLKDVGDKLFDNEEYFVLYRSEGKSVNEKFHPFL